MTKVSHYIGVDIAKNSFVVAIFCTKKQKYSTTKWDYQTPESISKFIDSLPAEAHCVMEATGVYPFTLGVCIDRTRLNMQRSQPALRRAVTLKKKRYLCGIKFGK